MKQHAKLLWTAFFGVGALCITQTAIGDDPKPASARPVSTQPVNAVSADKKPADTLKTGEIKAKTADEKRTDKTKAVDLVFDRKGNLMPKHFNERTQKAIETGMEYLKRTQSDSGKWRTSDATTYPVTMTSLAGMAMLSGGNTTSRGPYADCVKKAIRYLLAQANPQTGLISGPQESQPMYAHGFAMLFLSCAYGMESDPGIRKKMKGIIENGIKLISQAQSPLGGWYYTPGSQYDEGSVTVTQLQALRAASNAGFVVPESTIKRAIKYLEICRTSEGGIKYSARSGDQTQLPISAAALPCMYSTGDYESDMAKDCLAYVFKRFCAGTANNSWNKPNGFGHSYYAHFYAAQAFYQAGDPYWDRYFPAARDQLLAMQGQGNLEGAWSGDGIGPVYGTAIALTILQLPYKYLPIYQR